MTPLFWAMTPLFKGPKEAPGWEYSKLQSELLLILILSSDFERSGNRICTLNIGTCSFSSPEKPANRVTSNKEETHQQFPFTKTSVCFKRHPQNTLKPGFLPQHGDMVVGEFPSFMRTFRARALFFSGLKPEKTQKNKLVRGPGAGTCAVHGASPIPGAAPS